MSLNIFLCFLSATISGCLQQGTLSTPKNTTTTQDTVEEETGVIFESPYLLAGVAYSYGETIKSGAFLQKTLIVRPPRAHKGDFEVTHICGSSTVRPIAFDFLNVMHQTLGSAFNLNPELNLIPYGDTDEYLFFLNLFRGYVSVSQDGAFATAESNVLFTTVTKKGIVTEYRRPEFESTETSSQFLNWLLKYSNIIPMKMNSACN